MLYFCTKLKSMKSIKLLSLIIVGVLAFSSCKNNMSLTKRHYTKGYHFHKTKSVDQPEVKEGMASKNTKKTEKNEKESPLEIVQVKPVQDIETKSSSVSSNQTLIASSSKRISNTNNKVNAEKPKSLNQTKKQLQNQSKATKTSESSRGGGDSSTVKLILCVILAIFIPPLGMYIWNKKTDTWFIVDLILFLLLFTYLFWSGGLVGLAAVVIALLRVFDII